MITFYSLSEVEAIRYRVPSNALGKYINMKSNFKTAKGSKINVEVSLDNAEVKEYWDREYEREAAKVNLKGFRPGMAPREMVDKAIDKNHVLEHAVGDAIRFSLNKIVEENDWTVIDQPKVEVKSEPDALDKNKGLEYKAEITIFPKVELPDYKKIANKINADKKEVAVTEDEINKSLEWLKKSRATLVRAARPAKIGDVTEVDFETKLDGKILDGGKVEGDKFELGEGKFIPGFEEKLESHKEGDVVEFSLTAPSDYWNKDLQGKKLDFKVTIKAVFDSQLPEVNDDFAKSLGKFKDVAELKSNISDGLKMEKEMKETEKRRVKIVEDIVKNAKIDVPEVFVERTLDGLLEEYKDALTRAGKSAEDARKNMREAAEKRVVANIAITEIAKLENIEPSKEEIEEESRHHQAEAKDVDVSKYYDYIYGILINRKTFEFLERQ